MKFILNKTSGINGIEKISLEKIIQTFSVPKNIEINKKIKIKRAILFCDFIEITIESALFVLYFFNEFRF